MGVSFSILNIDKRQYLDPERFDENFKISGYMRGYHALALAVLACRSDGIGGVDFWPACRIAGSWYGDRIIAVMDTDAPNTHGIQTATPDNPHRNLYALAWQEYENISYKAIAMLTEWREDIAADLARRAAEPSRSRLLWHLGNVAASMEFSSLELALETHVRPNWRQRYEAARREHDRYV